MEKAGAAVEYHDPNVPVIRPSREHSRYAGRRSVGLTAESLAGFEAVLVATKHDGVDYPLLAASARLIVDTRNAFAGVPVDPAKYFKA